MSIGVQQASGHFNMLDDQYQSKSNAEENTSSNRVLLYLIRLKVRLTTLLQEENLLR
ncbi:hypothetical protein KIN20_025165 [Parelaphostrongylus tenuis]|uniref:Uncharacterized protein n=1 Tax=Parelaphostrongylus tenuis TaxID=148309 RepID=A0AAD5NAK0_PARTN|nr:hypothetical protein KIN20_025165 [Parelaphostrongylus tenuis]